MCTLIVPDLLGRRLGHRTKYELNNCAIVMENPSIQKRPAYCELITMEDKYHDVDNDRIHPRSTKLCAVCSAEGMHMYAQWGVDGYNPTNCYLHKTPEMVHCVYRRLFGKIASDPDYKDRETTPENWRFVGTDRSVGYLAFVRFYSERGLPVPEIEREIWCVCGVRIEHNYYIQHKDLDLPPLVVGSECQRWFQPLCPLCSKFRASVFHGNRGTVGLICKTCLGKRCWICGKKAPKGKGICKACDAFIHPLVSQFGKEMLEEFKLSTHSPFDTIRELVRLTNERVDINVAENRARECLSKHYHDMFDKLMPEFKRLEMKLGKQPWLKGGFGYRMCLEWLEDREMIEKDENLLFGRLLKSWEQSFCHMCFNTTDIQKIEIQDCMCKACESSWFAHKVLGMKGICLICRLVNDEYRARFEAEYEAKIHMSKWFSRALVTFGLAKTGFGKYKELTYLDVIRNHKLYVKHIMTWDKPCPQAKELLKCYYRLRTYSPRVIPWLK